MLCFIINLLGVQFYACFDIIDVILSHSIYQTTRALMLRVYRMIILRDDAIPLIFFRR